MVCPSSERGVFVVIKNQNAQVAEVVSVVVGEDGLRPILARSSM